MFYRLTVKGQMSRLIDAEMFHKWVKERSETIGINFKDRNEQLKRYTNLDVRDWEMEDA